MSLLYRGVSLCQKRVVELTDPNESCTSIAVGKLATTDGSVMTSQTCDGTSRTWMEVMPAKSGRILQNSIFIGISVIRKAKTIGWE